jgi:hypothetical protein
MFTPSSDSSKTETDALLERCWSRIVRGARAERDRLAAEISEGEIKPPGSSTLDEAGDRGNPSAVGEGVDAAAPVGQFTTSAVRSFIRNLTAPVRENDDPRIYQGCLKLEIVPPFGSEQLEGLPDWLAALPGLTVMRVGGYAGKNRWVTAYTIDLAQPTPLLEIIQAVPEVEDVSERDGCVVIRLR